MPFELGAWQQQKRTIIRSLIKQPSVIFAEEPTGSVDYETAQEILEHLICLKNKKQVTLIMAAHRNIPEKIAYVVFILENGRIKV